MLLLLLMKEINQQKIIINRLEPVLFIHSTRVLYMQIIITTGRREIILTIQHTKAVLLLHTQKAITLDVHTMPSCTATGNCINGSYYLVVIIVSIILISHIGQQGLSGRTARRF